MSEPERWMFEEGDLTSLKDDSWTPLEVIEPDPADRLMKSGVFRTLGEGGRALLSDLLKRSSGRQRSRPQEVEVCPAIALTLHELELVDKAFHRAGTPPKNRESRC